MKKPIDIYELMLNREFGELNSEEAQSVLSEMTADEYTLQRSALLELKNEQAEISNEIKPGKHVLQNLRSAMKKKEMAGNWNWYNYPVPAYQVAACLLFVLLSFFYYLNITHKPEKLLTELRDTVFVKQEIPVYIRDTIRVTTPGSGIAENHRLQPKFKSGSIANVTNNDMQTDTRITSIDTLYRHTISDTLTKRFIVRSL